MHPFGLLHPVVAVIRDSALALVRGSPAGRLLEHDERGSDGIPTFVMMPLDFASDSAWLSGAELEQALKKLVNAGVHGVMVDVWWGVCEPVPQQYRFERYMDLAETCKRVGLEIQATLCFHGCGENVGDTVHIPIPQWVRNAGDKHRVWFMDRAQYMRSKDGKTSVGDEDINREYISPGADDVPFVPCMDGEVRTPIAAYEGFITAFCYSLRRYIGSTITELQVGMGPSGELRYPSYPLANDKWKFPGIGELQCYDEHMLRDLSKAAEKAGHPEWAMPPDDAGSYNDSVWAAPFFCRGHRTPYGRFFLSWYSNLLLSHGDVVLKAARRAVGTDIPLAVKISGVHWWYFTRSRAAEANAGYYMSSSYNFYDKAAAMFKSHDTIFDFTCLEMKTWQQPWFTARSGPRQLVRDVFQTAGRHGVLVAGENALERYDMEAYNQVVKAFKWTKAKAHGFTLLRLTPALLEDNHLKNLKQLTKALRNIRARE